MTARGALRLSQNAAAIAKSQNNANSHRMTRNPRLVINPAADIGETGIGRQGRKYRVLSRGAKKATPSPPFVIASNNPCDAVIAAKKIASFMNEWPHFPRTARAAAPAPTKTAKSNEWVKPRCPKGCAYGIQGVNSASASGRTGSRIDAIRSRRSDAAPKAGLIAVNPITPWVKMVGIMIESEYK